MLFVYPLFVIRYSLFVILESLFVQAVVLARYLMWFPVLSLRTISRACERVSEAIPTKLATDVMNSLFYHNYWINGRDLSHQWAQNYFNSTIRQIPAANWAPFRVENPEHRDGCRKAVTKISTLSLIYF